MNKEPKVSFDYALSHPEPKYSEVNLKAILDTPPDLTKSQDSKDKLLMLYYHCHEQDNQLIAELKESERSLRNTQRMLAKELDTLRHTKGWYLRIIHATKLSTLKAQLEYTQGILDKIRKLV